MNLQCIADKMSIFFNQYNYLTHTRGNTLFLLKCIFLKYLVNNHHIDFIQYEKELKKNFTFDYFIDLWQGKAIEKIFWEEEDQDLEPLGNMIWEWICDFVTTAPSFEGENPRIIGDLYEESMMLNHKKNHGVFYTPENLADYMASKALEKYEVDEKYKTIRIFDPACGSGSLLNAVYERIFEMYGENMCGEEKEILHRLLLEKILVGVDRDSVACLVTRLILVLKGNTYVRPLGIQCGDILTEELIIEKSVDIIIGNPPYVGHKEIDSAYMKKLKNRYPLVYQDKGDLSYCFINRGWELLKQDGLLIHITSRYFLEAYYGKPLRSFIKSAFEIEEIVDFNGIRIIPGVGIDPAIIRLRKNKKTEKNGEIRIKRFFIKNHKPDSYSHLINSLDGGNKLEEKPFESYFVSQNSLSDDLWRLYSPITKAIIEKIEKKTPFTLDNIVHSFQGIITGNDKAFIFDNNDENLKNFEESHLKPWIKNKDVRTFTIAEPQKKILYTNEIDAIESDSVVLKHLRKYREKLEKRRECQNGKLPWYFLQWGRNPSHFERKKIIYPYKATKNRFAIDDKKSYFSADVYGLILKPRLYHKVTEELLVVLLNSHLYNYYFKSFAKKLGDKLYEYYPNTLLKLRIPDLDEESTRLFNGFYDKIIKISLLENEMNRLEILNTVDQWLYQYFELTETEIEEIEKEG
ncbi:Eco57I restriction-modification methylase domain-containing protein [Acetobacterium tundrae]|uniref:site-specific DNA-methyltransferase (adenine-specific) n=1 Tax=Acetobacterium tundrae TaxID=132932 RepID=A0ABR6WGU2_9FIRM|nr:N-6 DNA methylase [Acetobacterium tundrae]MBC3795690.1 N-6 DNA methylase [Acetobacterium tundrae]